MHSYNLRSLQHAKPDNKPENKSENKAENKPELRSYDEFVAWINYIMTKKLSECSSDFEAFCCLIVTTNFHGNLPSRESFVCMIKWKDYLASKYTGNRYHRYKPMVEQFFGAASLIYQLHKMYTSSKVQIL